MSINYELSAQIGSSEKKIILKDGFFMESSISGFFHKHDYAEVHLIISGGAQFTIDRTRHSMCAGDIFIVPADTFHSGFSTGEDTKHVPFLIDAPVTAYAKCSVSPSLLLAFFREIQKSKTANNFAKISAYISLLCSDFFPEETVCAHQMTDYAFMIHEFFSNNYSFDVALCDLAEELHLSEKQTERLVLKYTGKTFKQELIARRMTMAERLLSEGEMPLSEIAQYVGYHSYSGFWKAYKTKKQK